MKTDFETVTINGVEYVRADQLPEAKSTGNRAIVVVDRGWIYAGDITEENGRIKLSRAVWVFRWEKIGFNGVIDNPEKADIRKINSIIDIPAGSEIFRIPVYDEWGLIK